MEVYGEEAMNGQHVFLHNSARLHIAHQSQEILQKFKWEVWSTDSTTAHIWHPMTISLFYQIEGTLIWNNVLFMQ